MTGTLTRPSVQILRLTRSVSIYDAKTHLSKLAAEVESSATITIPRRGRPVASLQAFHPKQIECQPGLRVGQHWGIDVDWFEWTEQDEKD